MVVGQPALLQRFDSDSGNKNKQKLLQMRSYDQRLECFKGNVC